jgi:hypothetical protein
MPFPSYRYRYASSLALLIAGLCSVPAMQADDHTNRPAHVRKQVKTANQSPPSGNVQALPANVSLKDGNLTVDAHNSDLDQILKQVAQLGGMTIDGTTGTARVFGSYGPGNPQDVLSSLLIGSGCNFIMVGNAHDGVPRELLLSVNHGGSSIATPAAASMDHLGAPDAEAPEEEAPGPGAIVHEPPSGPDDPQERMQQNLQRLSHIRAQQGEQPE